MPSVERSTDGTGQEATRVRMSPDTPNKNFSRAEIAKLAVKEASKGKYEFKESLKKYCSL